MTVKLCTNSKHPFSDTEQFIEWGKYRPVFPFNTWLIYAKSTENTACEILFCEKLPYKRSFFMTTKPKLQYNQTLLSRTR